MALRLGFTCTANPGQLDSVKSEAVCNLLRIDAGLIVLIVILWVAVSDDGRAIVGPLGRAGEREGADNIRFVENKIGVHLTRHIGINRQQIIRPANHAPKNVREIH